MRFRLQCVLSVFILLTEVQPFRPSPSKTKISKLEKKPAAQSSGDYVVTQEVVEEVDIFDRNGGGDYVVEEEVIYITEDDDGSRTVTEVVYVDDETDVTEDGTHIISVDRDGNQPGREVIILDGTEVVVDDVGGEDDVIVVVDGDYDYGSDGQEEEIVLIIDDDNPGVPKDTIWYTSSTPFPYWTSPPQTYPPWSYPTTAYPTWTYQTTTQRTWTNPPWTYPTTTPAPPTYPPWTYPTTTPAPPTYPPWTYPTTTQAPLTYPPWTYPPTPPPTYPPWTYPPTTPTPPTYPPWTYPPTPPPTYPPWTYPPTPPPTYPPWTYPPTQPPTYPPWTYPPTPPPTYPPYTYPPNPNPTTNRTSNSSCGCTMIINNNNYNYYNQDGAPGLGHAGNHTHVTTTVIHKYPQGKPAKPVKRNGRKIIKRVGGKQRMVNTGNGARRRLLTRKILPRNLGVASGTNNVQVYRVMNTGNNKKQLVKNLRKRPMQVFKVRPRPTSGKRNNTLTWKAVPRWQAQRLRKLGAGVKIGQLQQRRVVSPGVRKANQRVQRNRRLTFNNKVMRMNKQTSNNYKLQDLDLGLQNRLVKRKVASANSTPRFVRKFN